MTERQWYYVVDQERRGPLTQSDMIDLAHKEEIVPDTLVWTGGMENWEPASKAFADHGIEPSSVGAMPMPERSEANQTFASDHPETFSDAIKTVFSRYATFAGRARRPEFWWFVLFVLGTSLALSFVDFAVLGMPDMSPLTNIFSLGILVPNLAVTARRLHDVGRSGWWQLLLFVPIIGLIVIIFWCAQKGDPGANKFGSA